MGNIGEELIREYVYIMSITRDSFIKDEAPRYINGAPSIYNIIEFLNSVDIRDFHFLLNQLKCLYAYTDLRRAIYHKSALGFNILVVLSGLGSKYAGHDKEGYFAYE